MSGDASREDGRFQTGQAVVLAGAHYVHDVFTAFLAPLLPLLIKKLDLTLFQAGWLDTFCRLPTMLNPLLGALIDRGGAARVLVIVAPAASATAMCLAGLAPSYGLLVMLLLACGVSVAGLHVAAPALMAEVSGNRVGRGMSFFMFGGELARVTGPIVATQAVTAFGLEGMWRIIPAGVMASLVLWWRLSRVPVKAKRARPAGLLGVCRRMSRVILAVTGVVVARSFMVAALTTFLPTFLVYSRGQGLWQANMALVVLEIAGAVGALTAGTISDWVGRRRVLLVAVGVSPPLMLVFLTVPGYWILPVLAVLGFVTLAIHPVLMALMIGGAGEDRAAMTGIYMMIVFSVRSLLALGVGALGDVVGLENTYLVCALVATLGIPCVLLIPRSAG